MGNMSNRKLRSGSNSKWPQVGPLGGGVDRIFSNFVYEDKSSPLALTIFCTHEAIIIISNTEHLDAREIDITVADRALLLKFTSSEDEVGGNTNKAIPHENDADVYKIPLMFEVDVAHIEAGYDNDLLHISLPRLDTYPLDDGYNLAQ